VTTDGTVTDMLAAAFLEPIDLVKLSVDVHPSRDPLPRLDLPAGATVMRRKIVLRGAHSGTNFVYAETDIAADRLSPSFREDLVAGRTPLGQLWLAHRLETWKERPTVIERPAAALSAILAVAPDTPIIERRYRTFTGGVPVFDVTEVFPRNYGSSAGRTLT